jgi:hypothetical protein
VATPVRVERLEQHEALDLAQALAVRGLVGRPVRSRGVGALEIHDAREDTQRLLTEVVEAVETWLADRQRDPVVISVGGRKRTVRARRDLSAALAARVPRRVRR